MPRRDAASSWPGTDDRPPAPVDPRGAARGRHADHAQPAGDASLADAVTGAELAVVGVLASLAPVVTVLLARVLTAERLTRLQAVGAALAMVGTLVVASGR